MPSPFAAAVTQSFAALQNAAGEAVTIRSGLASAEIVAVPAQTVSEIEQQDGLVVATRTRDYLIAAADWDFGAGPVEPHPGDRIEETLPPGAAVFEVIRLGDEHFRYWDKGRTVLRIHTREVE